jgi:tetratricopeptide (TPR) repeat protein
MIDSEGRVISWTGAKDIQAAGGQIGLLKPKKAGDGPGVPGFFNSAGLFPRHEGAGHIGEDFAAQANLMSNDKVWPAMAQAYQESKGDLAEHMLAALDAAQAVGGDIRGRQSAALIVVEGKRQNAPWEGRVFDLRVDDAAEPLKELRRLVVLQRAYNHMNAGDLAVEHKDNEAALREYAEAEKIASETPGILPSRLAEMIFWHAVALVNMNRVDDALPLFKKCFTIQKSWAELTPRLPAAGLLPNDPKLIEHIVQQRP